jgi:IclR family transcriptional regulator, pca regulon regulatory protein
MTFLQNHANGAGGLTVNKKDWIAGLEKGLAVIEVFDEANSKMTPTQVGQRCGLTRTAARRYLLTLQHLGYVSSDGKVFWLTPRVMRLSQSYLESARLPRIVQPALQRLTASTLEISYVSVLDGFDLVYVARNGPNRTMNTGFVLGARVPAQTTAGGMMMLASQGEQANMEWLAQVKLKPFTAHTITKKEIMAKELAQIRDQGWAMSEQQLDLAYRGVAVALRDRKGDTVAALSVIMPMANETPQEAVDRVLPLLQETAQSLRVLL